MLSSCWAAIKPLQVIYELTQGERQLIDDLSLVKKVFTQILQKQNECVCENVFPLPGSDFS